MSDFSQLCPDILIIESSDKFNSLIFCEMYVKLSTTALNPTDFNNETVCPD